MIFPNVMIGEGAQVTDSVLMPGVTVAPHAVISRAIIGPDAVVQENARIGGDGSIALVVQDTKPARKGVKP